MITVAIVGAVTALAMFAILAKIFAGEPPGTEKLQKADIIKQLLALSELENPAPKSPARVRAQAAQAASPTPRANASKPRGKTLDSGGSKPNSAKPAEPKASAVTALVKVSPSVPVK